MTGRDNQSGIIVVNKDKGISSHGVVNQIRKILGIKKVGHSGTLDPDVTGVLPMCIGKATRLSEYMLESDKSYKGIIKLGLMTDTQDLSGNIIKTSAYIPSREEIISSSKDFQGEISQVPPMYSAVHHNGKRLYELAREGIKVEPESRLVRIYDFIIESYDYPYIEFTCSCSKGTYIRTLAEDFGNKLGSLACLHSLIRTSSGHFKLEDSIKIESIKQKVLEGDFSFIKDMDSAISEMPELIIDDGCFEDIINGKLIPLKGTYAAGLYRIYCRDIFMGTGQVIKDKSYLKIEKMLYQE